VQDNKTDLGIEKKAFQFLLKNKKPRKLLLPWLNYYVKFCFFSFTSPLERPGEASFI